MTEYLFPFISVLIVGFLIFIAKMIERLKFGGLVGANKAIGVIIILLIVAESVYLAISLDLLEYALETITSLSAILIFLAFVYLNKLQNAAAGLSLAMSTKVNIGDRIEFENKKGTITQLGLTKTLVTIDDRDDIKIWVPNKKFDEEIFYVIPQKSKSHNNLKNSS